PLANAKEGVGRVWSQSEGQEAHSPGNRLAPASLVGIVHSTAPALPYGGHAAGESVEEAGIEALLQPRLALHDRFKSVLIEVDDGKCARIQLNGTFNVCQ